MVTREHGESHEAVLRQILTGDLDATDAKVRDLATHCTSCRQELDDLLQLQAALDQDARDERASLDASREAEPGEIDVGSMLRSVAQRESRPPSATAVHWWIPLAALLVIGATIWLVLGTGEEDVPTYEPTPLGPGDGLVLEEVDRSVAGQLTFRWSAEVGEGGYYEVRVWDAEAAGSPPWRERLDLEENQWSLGLPPPHERPARLRWRVEAFNFFGDPLFEEEGEVSLDGP